MVVWFKELWLFLFLIFAEGFFTSLNKRKQDKNLEFLPLKMLLVNTDQSHFCADAVGTQEVQLSKSAGVFVSALRMPTKNSTICILKDFTHAAFWCPPTWTVGDKVCSEVATAQPPESSTFIGDVKPEWEWWALGGILDCRHRLPGSASWWVLPVTFRPKSSAVTWSNGWKG